MLARLRIASPAATSAPPIQLASTGLPVDLGVRLQLLGGLRSGRSWPAASGSPACRRCWDPWRRSPAPWRSARGRHRRGCRPGCCGSRRRAGTALSASMVSWRELGQLAAAGDQRVGGQHAGAAGVGQDRQARALRARLLGQHFGHVEQLGDAVHAQHAAAAEGGSSTSSLPVSEPVCEAAALAAAVGAPGLDDDDRLGQRHFARGREERAGVADRSPCR